MIGLPPRLMLGMSGVVLALAVAPQRAEAFWERGVLFRCADATTLRERQRFCPQVRPWIGVEWEAVIVDPYAAIDPPAGARIRKGEAVVRRLY